MLQFPDQSGWSKGRIGWWAPGMYSCRCVNCGRTYMGDKRSAQCYPCASAPTHHQRNEVMMDPARYDGSRPEPPYNTDTDAVVMLQDELDIMTADRDRLAAELQAVRDEHDRIRSLLKDVFDHYDVDRFRSARGNAPGHAHATPGIWDEDNGERSGKPCAWCATWSRVKSAVAQQEGGTA